MESTLVELLRASRDADWTLADSLAARLVDELAASSAVGERRHALLTEAQQVVAEVMRAASTARRAVGSEARQLARGRKAVAAYA